MLILLRNIKKKRSLKANQPSCGFERILYSTRACENVVIQFTPTLSPYISLLPSPALPLSLFAAAIFSSLRFFCLVSRDQKSSTNPLKGCHHIFWKLICKRKILQVFIFIFSLTNLPTAPQLFMACRNFFFLLHLSLVRSYIVRFNL